MKKIVIFPNKILRVKTEVITRIDRKLLEETNEVEMVLMGQKFGAGLAATQLGFNRRFFGLKNQDRKVDIYLNPKLEATYGPKIFPIIQNKDGDEDFIEGCLSFPDLWGTVKRYLKIEASWDMIAGDKLVKKRKIITGFEAIVWQHEADHLDGILFVDLVKKDGGKFFWWTDGGEKIPMNVDEVLKKEKK